MDHDQPLTRSGFQVGVWLGVCYLDGTLTEAEVIQRLDEHLTKLAVVPKGPNDEFAATVADTRRAMLTGFTHAVVGRYTPTELRS